MTVAQADKKISELRWFSKKIKKIEKVEKSACYNTKSTKEYNKNKSVSQK